jgi:hypothetical protein
LGVVPQEESKIKEIRDLRDALREPVPPMPSRIGQQPASMANIKRHQTKESSQSPQQQPKRMRDMRTQSQRMHATTQQDQNIQEESHYPGGRIRIIVPSEPARQDVEMLEELAEYRDDEPMMEYDECCGGGDDGNGG